MSHSNEEMSASETFAVQLSNDEPAYFAAMSGIFCHLTYVVKSTRKRLSGDAVLLYLYLKQTTCSKTIYYKMETIAKTLRFPLKTCYKLFEELRAPMEQLSGIPLIESFKVFKNKQDKNGTVRKVWVYNYKINNIWGPANAYMSTFKHHVPLELGEINLSTTPTERDGKVDLPILHPENRFGTDSLPRESLMHTDSPPRESLPQGTPQCPNKTNLFKKHNSVTEEDADSCSVFSQGESVSGERGNVGGTGERRGTGGPSGERGNLLEEHQDKQARKVATLRSFGCDDSFIKEVTSKYSDDQIVQAGSYTKEMASQGKVKSWPAYFRKALEKGWKIDSSDRPKTNHKAYRTRQNYQHGH